MKKFFILFFLINNSCDSYFVSDEMGECYKFPCKQDLNGVSEYSSIPSSNVKIDVIGYNELNYTCKKGESNIEIPISFKLYTPDQEKFGALDEETYDYSLSKIGVKPIISGNTQDFTVLTDKSQWCTNTCGIINLEISARCPTEGDIYQSSIFLKSGGINYSEIIKLSVN